MFKQKPFPFSFLVLFVLIALHLAASYYSWYWIYPWFDILVHIVSGLWLALVMLWLFSCLGLLDSLRGYKIKIFLIAFVSAILIGVSWELLENLTQIISVDAKGYSWNTILDILSDALGGVLAYLYFIRRKKCLNEMADNLHPFYNQTGVIKI